VTSDAAAGGSRLGDDADREAGRRVRDMLAQDVASAALGIELTDVGPGRAQVRMTVRPDMVQGHGTCHGGLVATLADTAFAAACNSRGEGPSVAASADVSWVRPAFEGDVLVADADERVRSGRTGVTDVTVRREADGEVVALFRGRSVELRQPPAPGPRA
jgi:phenylacetic acid degradation protein PaaD